MLYFFETIGQLIKTIWNSELQIALVLVLAPLIQILIKTLAPLLIRIMFFRVNHTKERGVLVNKRVKTLAGVIEATSLVLISGGVIIFIFQKININLTPLIAGAGILSLAVGFGAQSLVKDIIAGIFIILENQYNKGDWIKIDNYQGKVVDLNLRRTVLQTAKGSHHLIPNGQIKIVTNNSNKFVALSLNIPAKVDKNFNKVNKIINRVGRELATEENFKSAIIEIPEAVGVDKISATAATIKIWGKVKPGKQVKIRRELAERIIREFAKHKIELPGKIINQG